MILPELVKTEEFLETDDEASDTVEENKESYEENTSDIKESKESYKEDNSETSNITDDGSVHNRDYYRKKPSILETLNNSVVNDVMFLFKTQMVMIFLTLLMKCGIGNIKQKGRDGATSYPKTTRI